MNDRAAIVRLRTKAGMKRSGMTEQRFWHNTMSMSFEIEKGKFGITRYVFASFVEFNVFFHCYLTLPISTIYLMAWIGNGGEPLPRIITSLPGFALIMWLWLAFCLPIAYFFIAIREKMRLPIRVELTSASLVLTDKKGKRWSIRYANCRYASDFVRCSFNCFFKGTLQRGIKIYVRENT